MVEPAAAQCLGQRLGNVLLADHLAERLRPVLAVERQCHEHLRSHALSAVTLPPATDTRHDRIRWGAVWTGALTTLTIYLALQLLFFALGWLDLGNEGSGTTRAVKYSRSR